MRKLASLVAALLLAAATPVLAQTSPGVSDTEIAIGLTAPLSGPAAAWGNAAIAAEAWAKHVNEQGGVNGRRLRVSIADDGYSPARALTNLMQMKDRAFMNVGLWEGAHIAATVAVPGEAEADRVLEIATRIEPRLRGAENTAIGGIVAMAVAVEGLRRAGRALTRESFVEAMETVKNFSAERLTAPITFGPGRRHGLNAVRLMRADSAERMKVSQVAGYQVFQPRF